MTNDTSNPGRSAFFYGTLMAPQVLHRVCHGSTDPSNPIYATHNLKAHPAILPSHRRHRVKGADYPGILPHEGAEVRGTFVSGLTEADIWRLDIFEGSEYSRQKVKCKLLDNDEEREAETYIWISGKEELEEREWDFEEFQREKMQFWVGAEREDYAGRPSILEVDEAVAAAEKQQDGTRGRGANGHISNALKEEQEKDLKAAV